MKSNLRNKIKPYIVRQSVIVRKMVDLLWDEHGWLDSVSNLSNRFQREFLHHAGVVQFADALRYEIA